jgi:hypothetical protein
MSTEYVTLSPEDVARTLGTSAWWVREQARRGRVPHLRLGKGRIRLLPEHVDALVALFTVESRPHDAERSTAASVDLVALGSTTKSLTAHRRRPHVQGDGQLF